MIELRHNGVTWRLGPWQRRQVAAAAAWNAPKQQQGGGGGTAERTAAAGREGEREGADTAASALRSELSADQEGHAADDGAEKPDRDGKAFKDDQADKDGDDDRHDPGPGPRGVDDDHRRTGTGGQGGHDDDGQDDERDEDPGPGAGEPIGGLGLNGGGGPTGVGIGGGKSGGGGLGAGDGATSERVQRGEVTIGDPGSPRLQRRLAMGKNALRYCYERALRTDPTVAGRFDLTLTVAADGTVSDVHSGGLSSTNLEPVAACAVSQVRRMKFPEGEVETATVPIVVALP
ncbi:MAG: AgmX/PglI C-terminal domain-containing protein [Kofleriaceae bacterium]|nr:AgmX/PglI C-terminal domain-containing protein [Kofleriaceae bacterium]